MVTVKKIALLLFFNFLCSSYIFAEETSFEDTVRQLQKRVEALEEKVSEQEKYIATQNAAIQQQQEKISEYQTKLPKIEEGLSTVSCDHMQLMERLEIGVGGTMIVQGTNNVNYNGEGETLKESRTDASYSVDITLGKEFKEIGSKAFLHLEAGQGAGLEDNLTLYGNVNRDAADNEAKAEVTEFWYEQKLFNEKIVLTFGKLDPTIYFDQNEVANDETRQFLGRIFRNSPTVEFPDNTVGIRIAYFPIGWLQLGCGILDGNSDWEKIGDKIFNIMQLNFKTNFF